MSTADSNISVTGPFVHPPSHRMPALPSLPDKLSLGLCFNLFPVNTPCSPEVLLALGALL